MSQPTDARVRTRLAMTGSLAPTAASNAMAARA